MSLAIGGVVTLTATLDKVRNYVSEFNRTLFSGI